MTVQDALRRIEKCQNLEEQTRKITAAIKAVDPKDSKNMTLEEAGITVDYMQDLYIQLHSMNVFYQEDLGRKKVDCNW